MNVRIASATTIRSGVITSRIETRVAVAQDLVHRDEVADEPLDLGERPARRAAETSRNVRASGRAAASSACSRPNTLSSHQRAASGNDSSRSVSPVGAQSTTITSHSPDSTWRLSRSRLNSSSPPGGTVSSSAAIRSTPRSMSTPPSHSCTARPVALELVLRLHLLGPQAAADRRSARRRRGVSSDVGERVRRVGREHERARARGGAAARGGGGDRRLADAALARVEDGPRAPSRPASLPRRFLAASAPRPSPSAVAGVAREVGRGQRAPS